MTRIAALLLVLALVCATAFGAGLSEQLQTKLVSHVRLTRAHMAEGQLLQQALQRWQSERLLVEQERKALEQEAGCSIDWTAMPPGCAAEGAKK